VTDPSAGRLDAELVRRGLARSRGQARELVAQGTVLVDGTPAAKPSSAVTSDSDIVLTLPPERWVGRAAYKLLEALRVFGPRGLDVVGKRCLDVGASTGGFTQVLLDAGAAQVMALDVGHDQLAVADLSFISLRLVLDIIAALMTSTADAVLLVKPQFEVGRERLARTGVVTSAHEHEQVLDDVREAASTAGLRERGLVASPIRGATGNQEYLLWVSTGPGATKGAP
jgi:23S rRNA (cytidine1920-2'-O)/16S rRNA (cytidine1409-2'-O)-methyltransferase